MKKKVLATVLCGTMALSMAMSATVLVKADDKTTISLYTTLPNKDAQFEQLCEEFMEENPDQLRHNAAKLYLNVKKMLVYMMEATNEMCTRIDHMENLQGRSFADDILPDYQSEEELEALEEQRQKEQRKSFWSSLFGKKEK